LRENSQEIRGKFTDGRCNKDKVFPIAVFCAAIGILSKSLVFDSNLKTEAKIIMRTKITAVALLAVLLIATLAACGGEMTAPRNGTYRSEGLLAQTWTFSGTNDVTMSTAGGLVSSSGTYAINGNRLTITSTLLGTETTSGYTITEITRDTFRIDGTLFTRQ